MISKQFRALSALVFASATLVACNDGSGPVTPGAVEIVAGGQQTAPVGTVVPIAPAIKVVSKSGKPMAGVEVTFASSGDGVVTPTRQKTNAQGLAPVASWTLPRQAGPQGLTVTVNGVAAVTISVTAVAGPAATVVRGSPDQQTASAMSIVAAAPIVRVADAYDNAVAGVTVAFTASHGGSVGASTALTDGNGLARAISWTLGTTAGAQTLTASVAGAPPVSFTATALPGVATSLRLSREPSSTARAGLPLLTQPTVQIADQWGNPIGQGGVEITAVPVGSPALMGAVATTNAAGLATFSGMTMTGTAGSYNLRFNGGNYTPVTSRAIRLEGGVPVKLAIVTQPATTNGSGELLGTQPVVEIHDEWNNQVLVASHAVTATVLGTSQTLSGTLGVQAASGRAVFTDLRVTGTGDVQLRFSAFGLPDATSASFNVPLVAGCAGARMVLDYALGQTARFAANSTSAPACLDFTAAAAAGHQYAVLFENMTTHGSYISALFPGGASDDGGFAVSIESGALSNASTASSRTMRVPAGAVHSWNFGSGEIYEIEPTAPAGGARPAMVQRNQSMMDASMSTSAAAVGDTIIVYMEGIPRLGINAGNRQAVIRYSGPDLIIAEDIRLDSLTRQNGGKNTPLTQADMAAIAADYAAYAKVQADRFFGGRHNSATEASGSRPIAVHSLMPADNIWGYTYSNTNYFVWDYWVLTDGVTKGVNQHVQRNSDNLFMHEIAHMRHRGMLERAGRTSARGNRWLVEGFARGSERWPIAMRLLGTADFSRIGNVILPLNTAFLRSSLEDVPAYTVGGFSVYGGYAQASYIFDYFADQVAHSGGNWMTALSEFLTAAGIETDLNTVIARYLPGLDFGSLVTRSRIAFFTDDYGPGLPAWMHYHQYQLRASRQTLNPALDPRNLWKRIIPGTAFSDAQEVTAGGSLGYLIDGGAATADARIRITAPRTRNGVISVTRIK